MAVIAQASVSGKKIDPWREVTVDVPLSTLPEGSWYAVANTNVPGLGLRALVATVDFEHSHLTATYDNPHDFPIELTTVALVDEDG